MKDIITLQLPYSQVICLPNKYKLKLTVSYIQRSQQIIRNRVSVLCLFSTEVTLPAKLTYLGKDNAEHS